MQPPFSILKTRGDGSLAWVEGAQTFDAAKARVEELAKFWPGKYVILNEETGERVSIITGGNTEIQ